MGLVYFYFPKLCLIFVVNRGKYASLMDPMGISISIIELWFVHMYLVGALVELKETCLTPTSGIGQKTMAGHFKNGCHDSQPLYDCYYICPV